jgi:hypothetical protein
MGNTIYSMRGKAIDMEKMALRNEKMPAVGNMKVNARGDQLGPGGEIIKTREEILADYYAKDPNGKKNQPK